MTGTLKRLLRGILSPGSIRAREEERWCLADPHPSGSYNYKFLKSRAEGDFVRHPDLLWSPNPYWTARAGLNAHVRLTADDLAGAVYSDALVVLHPEDYARTEASMLESWSRAAHAELEDCFERLVDSHGFTLAMPGRGFQLKIIADGDAFLGTSLGLDRREFATALLPNLYLGPTEDSAPLVEVFVSKGGGRFTNVGTVWSDQLAFTIGAHALDNHTMEELGDSAVYTVHRFPGEPGLHHRLNGERADRLLLRTGAAHGGETIEVFDAGREKVIFEVMLVSARAPEAELPVPGERRGRVAGAKQPLLALPFAPLPPGAGEGTILPHDVDLGDFGAFSIIPDALPDKIHTLSERGCLLQRVHFGSVMSGYTMELDRGGRIWPKAADPVARFEVRGEHVSVSAPGRELTVDGRPLEQGEVVPLSGSRHTIGWRNSEVEFESLRRKDRRFPYLARISTPRHSTPLAEGEVWMVGRDTGECDVPLPDRLTTDNIIWKDGASEGPVEVRGGKVSRDNFRTDAIFVASKAAELDLTGDQPILRNPSTSCPLHVMRSREVVRVKQQGGEIGLKPGDELLLGNHSFVLLGPGEEDQPVKSTPSRAPVPIADLSERLDAGPGKRGRRPRVGGAQGKIVEPSRTYGSVLGISPASERSSARTPSAPTPVVASGPAPTAVVVSEPTPSPIVIAAPPAPEKELSELDTVPSMRIPTECAPSLSLDMTVDSTAVVLVGVDDEVVEDSSGDDWLRGGGSDSDLDGPMTVVDEDPDWEAHFAAVANGEPTRDPTADSEYAIAPREDVVFEEVDDDAFEEVYEEVGEPIFEEVAEPIVAATEAPRLPRGLQIPLSPRVVPTRPQRPVRTSPIGMPLNFGPLPARRRGAPLRGITSGE